MHVGDGAAGGGGSRLQQVDRGLEVGVPTEPAVVTGVDVVVDVRDGTELVQRVANTVDVVAVGLHHVAVRGRRGGAAGVRDQVRQRVDLDRRHDTQVRVGRVGKDRGDRVDELALVTRQVGRAELTVGRKGGTVTAGEVVDDELHDVRLAGGLGHSGVEVGAQAHRGAGAVDRGDPVQPHRGGLVGDRGATGLGGGEGGPLRVHVNPGTHVGVVDLGGGLGLVREGDRHDCGGGERHGGGGSSEPADELCRHFLDPFGWGGSRGK